MKKYFKLTGKILLFLFIYQFFMFLYSAIMGAVIGFRFAMNNPKNLQSQLVTEHVKQIMLSKMYIPVFLAAITSLIIYYFIYKSKSKNLIKTCNFSKVGFKALALTLISGISFALIVRFILYLMSKNPAFTEILKNYGQHMKLIVNYEILNILVMALIVPITEEILFRGMILNELLDNVSLAPAVIIQALLFGLYHMNLVQGLYAFIMGLILGILYCRFKTIWVPIIFHAAVNAIGIINTDFFQSTWTVIIAILTLVISLILLNKEKDISIKRIDSSI
ncbi:MAG: CPBP family intramembrane metalloprotease [Caloramator sp.]|nr:CPBP family intramembrane metalloprotease [Caloramator sp.]